MRRYGFVLATVALVLCWGSTFAAVKIGLRSCPPMMFAGLRSTTAGLLMCGAAASRGRPLHPRAGTYTLLTAFNVVGFLGLQTLAIQHLPSGLSAVLIYLQPVLTAALAWPLLGERIGPLGVSGLVLAFGGIVVVTSSASGGHVSVPGIVYAVLCALAWSLGTIVYKRQAGTVDAWWAVAIPFVAGGVVLTVIGLVSESASITWSGEFVGALAFTVVLGTSVSWLLWFKLVEVRGASRAAANVFFVPLIAIAVGVLVLGERLHPTLVIGSALVVLGVYLVNRPTRTGT